MENSFIYNSQDNFEKIIKQCPIVINSRFIKAVPLNNGKSSFCFSVKTEVANYIFKFPRTVFQYRGVNYEKEVVRFLCDRIDCEIPEINIFADTNKRPYIVYKQIEGEDMADVNLSNEEVRILCRQLVKNLICIHSKIGRASCRERVYEAV